MASVTQTQPETIFEGAQISDGESALLAEEQDYGYELGSEPEDGESLDEEDDGADLEAKDGKEPWEADDLHTLGITSSCGCNPLCAVDILDCRRRVAILCKSIVAQVQLTILKDQKLLARLYVRKKILSL